jgi:cytoskeletal protein RodZ
MDSQSPEMILKETRQAKGISIEAVHEATKIPLDVLKAMEEGYTVRALASPFYRKQFIKMYAAFLGIEIKESAFAELPKEEVKPAPFKRPPVKEKQFEPKKGFTLTKQQKQQIVLAVGSVLALFLVTKAVAFIGSKIAQHKANQKTTVKAKEKPKAAKKKKAEKAKAKKIEIKEVKKEEAKKPESKKAEVKEEAEPIEPVAIPIPVVPAQAEIPLAEPEPEPREEAKEVKAIEPKPRSTTSAAASMEAAKVVNLTVRAKKKSWLQVKVDGNTVFQSSLQKGAVENWQAEDQIELTGNNILFLEFEVNGKMIGTLSRTEGRARKLIVTKDGLSVKR